MAKKAAKAATKGTSGSKPIDVGKTAPAFDLTNQDGQSVQLKELRGKWVVLYFYPKDNTPGCTKQACQFRDAWSKLKRRGMIVLGISPDDQASHGRFASKYTLPFDLLADTTQMVCRKYGVWQQKSLYGRKFMGVVRTTYLVDPKGKVAHRWDKVKVADHEQAVLEKLDELRRI